MLPLPVLSSIRASHISNWQKCPRIWAWKDLLGLGPKDVRLAMALLVGSAYHARRNELLAKTAGTTAAFQKEITESLKSMPTDRQATALQELTRAVSLGSAMAEVADTLLPFGEHYEILAVELEAKSTIMVMGPHGPTPVLFAGRLDYLLKDKRDGTVLIDDEKTTKDIPFIRAAVCPFEPQTGLYPLLVAEHKPKGVVHSIIQKPTIHFCGKDPTFDDYVKRVRQVYTEKASTGKAMVGRSTTILPYPLKLPVHLEADVRNILNFLNAAGCHHLVVPSHDQASIDPHRILNRIEHLPMHIHQCVAYGKMCTYHALCHSDPVTWESTIDNQFAQASVAPEPDTE